MPGFPHQQRPNGTRPYEDAISAALTRRPQTPRIQPTGLAARVADLQSRCIEADSAHARDMRVLLDEIDHMKKQLQNQEQQKEKQKPRLPPPKQPLTHKENIALAMQNPFLRQIATGMRIRDDMPLVDAYHAEAAAADAIAVELRKAAAQLQSSHSIPSPSPSPSASPLPAQPWTPIYLTQQPPPSLPALPPPHATETFTWTFLTSLFAGVQYSPGFYAVPATATTSPLRGKCYWLLDEHFEPLLPKGPGLHGAKLTAFYNTDAEGPGPDDYTNVPLFIGRAAAPTPGSAGSAGPEPGKGKSQENETANDEIQYTYFGSYSQPRFSDRLDHDRVSASVPAAVKRYWAVQLSAVGRPDWVTEALRMHFWPMPGYVGPLGKGDREGLVESSDESGICGRSQEEEAKKKEREKKASADRKVRKAMAEYLEELRDWEKESRLKVQLIGPETIMKAFEEADAAEEPGLRLWLEYLVCVGWDAGFYQMLVRLKRGA